MMNRSYNFDIKRALRYVVLTLTCSVLGMNLNAQEPDVRAERLMLDDNGGDGTQNTISIQAPDSLSQDMIITIPDPGAAGAEFILLPSGSSGPWLLDGNSGTMQMMMEGSNS